MNLTYVDTQSLWILCLIGIYEFDSPGSPLVARYTLKKKKKSVNNSKFLKIYCSFMLFTENRDREVEKYKMLENSDLNLKCDFSTFSDR